MAEGFDERKPTANSESEQRSSAIYTHVCTSTCTAYARHCSNEYTNASTIKLVTDISIWTPELVWCCADTTDTSGQLGRWTVWLAARLDLPEHFHAEHELSTVVAIAELTASTGLG